MKPNRFLLALLIALFIHTLLLGLFWFWITPKPKSDNISYYKEKRFGITLSEEAEIADSIPALTRSHTHITEPTRSAPQNTPIIPTKGQETLPKTQLRHINEADRDSLPFSVLHHYGDEFFALSAGEQHYIIDNLQKIRKINEMVGTRLLRERPDDVDPMDNNVVEFLLNPDGSISGLTLEKNRIGTPLDELTLQTINLAHAKYPKPEQPTKVRIRVYIIVK